VSSVLKDVVNDLLIAVAPVGHVRRSRIRIGNRARTKLSSLGGADGDSVTLQDALNLRLGHARTGLSSRHEACVD